jgi:hypothetical protein
VVFLIPDIFRLSWSNPIKTNKRFKNINYEISVPLVIVIGTTILDP